MLMAALSRPSLDSHDLLLIHRCCYSGLLSSGTSSFNCNARQTHCPCSLGKTAAIVARNTIPSDHGVKPPRNVH
ncbi:hypothetical protein RSAG8_05102, partial [Rhizoctonia solani AG-8 WAC10335]